MLHQLPEQGDIGMWLQRTELEYLFESRTAQTMLAENYDRLPY
jgi:p-hydroxybenzoate 3-monooxygenase